MPARSSRFLRSSLRILALATTWFVANGAVSWAQTIPDPSPGYQPLGRIKAFLQLSDVQLQSLLTINDEYNRWAFGRQSRIAEVQAELVEETDRSPLSPYAIGIRYAEIETICREMRDEAYKYRTYNLNVLSQDQKARLKVLEEAMQLFSVVLEGQSGNLIGTLSHAPPYFTSAMAGFSIDSDGGFVGPANGCHARLSTPLSALVPRGPSGKSSRDLR